MLWEWHHVPPPRRHRPKKTVPAVTFGPEDLV